MVYTVGSWADRGGHGRRPVLLHARRPGRRDAERVAAEGVRLRSRVGPLRLAGRRKAGEQSCWLRPDGRARNRDFLRRTDRSLDPKFRAQGQGFLRRTDGNLNLGISCSKSGFLTASRQKSGSESATAARWPLEGEDGGGASCYLPACPGASHSKRGTQPLRLGGRLGRSWLGPTANSQD